MSCPYQNPNAGKQRMRATEVLNGSSPVQMNYKADQFDVERGAYRSLQQDEEGNGSRDN